MPSCGWTGIRDNVSGTFVLCILYFCILYIQTIQTAKSMLPEALKLR